MAAQRPVSTAKAKTQSTESVPFASTGRTDLWTPTYVHGALTQANLHTYTYVKRA